MHSACAESRIRTAAARVGNGPSFRDWAACPIGRCGEYSPAYVTRASKAGLCWLGCGCGHLGIRRELGGAHERLWNDQPQGQARVLFDNDDERCPDLDYPTLNNLHDPGVDHDLHEYYDHDTGTGSTDDLDDHHPSRVDARRLLASSRGTARMGLGDRSPSLQRERTTYSGSDSNHDRRDGCRSLFEPVVRRRSRTHLGFLRSRRGERVDGACDGPDRVGYRRLRQHRIRQRQ